MMDDQFDFEKNTDVALLEWLRAKGAEIIGPGTPFKIKMVGPGVDVTGEYMVFLDYGSAIIGKIDRCFPAHTRIQTSRTTSTAISALRVGDVVLAFDARADKGRGALVPRRVARLYRNTTTDWIRLRWFDGTAREVITTPGHHFLDRFGAFPTIEEMLENGKATVILASGETAEVTAARITYSAQTAHLFEQAQAVAVLAGKAAIAAVVASKLLWRVAVRKFDRGVTPKCFAGKSWSKIAAAVFLGAAITITPAHADTGKYFEKWTKSEGFDIGYACNWWKDVPGPESMFEVRKLKSAEILADIDSAEFRMIKPNSAKRTFDSLDGSLFDIRLDREVGTVRAIRILYPFGRNGYCGFIVKDADGSAIEILRGSAVPNMAVSPKAMRWVGQNIAACHRRLRRAVDPNILFDCVRSLDPNSTNDQPSEGLWESVMPEGVVPASVARIFIQNRGKTFAVTTFGDTIEIFAVGGPQ